MGAYHTASPSGCRQSQAICPEDNRSDPTSAREILKATYTLRLDLPIDEGTSKPGPVSKVRISP